MADTIALLNLTPKDALISLINDANNLRLDSSFVDFSNIRAVGVRKTTVNVGVKKTTNPFDIPPNLGNKDFTYYRMHLGEFFAATEFNLNFTLPLSTREVVTTLSARLGYVFDDNDFINEWITRGTAYPYTLKASPLSLRWVGELKLNLLSLQDLAALTVNSDLGTLVNPLEVVPTKPIFQKPWTDGLRVGGYLNTFVGPTVVETDTGLLAAVQLLYGSLGLTWVNTAAPAANNLYNARVLYNGLANAWGAVPYNPRLNRLVVLELDPVYCSGVGGRLNLYYNNSFPVPKPINPVVYKKPAELLNLSGYLVSNDIVKLYQGDVLTQEVPIWHIGDVVFGTTGLPDALRWTISATPRDNNAYGAKVLFNGYNHDYPPAYNPRFDCVLVLQLSEVCTNLRGVCYIYYNLDKVS